MRNFSLIFFFLLLAVKVQSKNLQSYNILFVDLKNDIRYTEWGLHPVDIRSKIKKEKRAIAGAKLAISEAKKLERLTKTSFTLEYISINKITELENIFINEENTPYNSILLDLSEKHISSIKEYIEKNENIIFFNVSEPDNNLRTNFCLNNFFSSYPSNQMLTDSTVQYLIEKKWKKTLILTGPLKQDEKLSKSFRISANKFGLKVTGENFFVNSNDPRVKDKNNLSFLTKGKRYDSIFISDTEGEFALSVPNASVKSTVVTGSSGLQPKAWHWSYLRHGAPQLNGRFERLSNRRMESKDWAAWAAIKSLVEAVVRTKKIKSNDIINFLFSDNFKLDGSKGIGLNYRTKTNQLRQPILLISGNNWVTSKVPLESFKNRKNDLDTIGLSSENLKCN